MKRKILAAGAFFGVLSCTLAFSACDGGHTHTGETIGRGNGSHWKICSECQAHYDEEAHTSADGACTVCGFVPNATQGLELEWQHGGGYAVKGIGTATGTEIVIPSYYANEPVDTITYDAFKNNTQITNVVIPDTVTVIRDNAFNGCTSLTGVTFGAHTQQLGNAVFKNCTALTEFVLPQGISTIGDHLFEKCTALKSVTIPASVTKIDFQAFIFCDALDDIYFEGTQAQWDAVEKGATWDYNEGEKKLHFNAG